jgi:choline-sulfatase
MKLLRLLLPLLILTACGQQESVAPRILATNAPIIVISIDTLRADHLPAYGYTGVQTPHLDAFRKDSILFSHAWTHAPLTLPAHASILTGLLPPDHGVRNNIGFRFDAARHQTIPSLLKTQGYATGAAVSAYVLRGETGLAAPFDFYDDEIAAETADAIGNVQRRGEDTVAIAANWIAQHQQQPFFFMLHLFEPHTPYRPTYDADIAAADRILGRFLDSLKQSGLYERSIIFVLSDHGEGLGDHGEDEHGIFLYREAIQVPLMLKLPSNDRANTTVEQPAALIDVLPTIASMTGVAVPEGAKGTSLLELANTPVRRIYSETLYPRIHLGWSDLRSLVDDRFHLVDGPSPELFALSDRREATNALDDQRRVYAAMKKDLDAFPRAMPGVGDIDPEEAKKLAALGYLSSTSVPSDGPLTDPREAIAELRLLNEAAGLAKSGRRSDAITAYRRLLDRNPRLTDAWTALGRVLEETGQLDEAVDTYQRAIGLAPSLAPELGLSLAAVYLMLNRPDDATAHARLGLSTNPGYAHVLLGRAALARGDLATASIEAEAVMKDFSFRPAAMVLRAQVLTRQRRLDDAMREIDNALAEVQRNKLEVPPLLHFVRGDLLARLNRTDEAVAAFNEEIRLFPHDREAYASLAVIHALSGRKTEAHRTMERLVEANPNSSSYALAAKTFEEIGDAESARVWRR